MTTAIDVRRAYWHRLADAAAIVGGSPPDPGLYLWRAPTPAQKRTAMAIGVVAAIFYGHDALSDVLGAALLREMMDDLLKEHT